MPEPSVEQTIAILRGLKSRFEEHHSVKYSAAALNSAAELSNILLTDRRDTYLHSVVNKMLTYALGRGLEYYDMPTVDRICANVAKADHRFSAMVLEVVKSAPFQMRRGGSAVAEFAGK